MNRKFHFQLFTFLLLSLFALSSFGQSSSKPLAQKLYQYKQEGRSFAKYDNLFSPADNNVRESAIASVVSDAQLLTLNKAQVQEIIKGDKQVIELSIPFNGRPVTVELFQRSVLAEGFLLKSSGTYDQALPVSEAKYYRGIVKGDETAVVALSFFENEVVGMISNSDGNIVIGKLEYEGNTSEYIVYNDRNMLIKNPGECHAEELEEYQQNLTEKFEEGKSRGNFCVDMYLECDYRLYQNKGSSVVNTKNWISAAFNNVSTLFDNETVETAIQEIFVWTTQDNYSTTSSNTALNQFKALRPNINGDLGQLCSLSGGNAGLGGIAFLSGLCNNNKYSYSGINSGYSNVPLYSWTIMVMTHEIGHNLSSNHTHNCNWPGGAIDNCYTTEGGCAPGPAPTNGGTIMSYCHLTSYGINLANGFGPLPGNKIRSYVNSRSCLGPCSGGGGGGGCDAPTNVNATNITSSSALISWTAPPGGIAVSYTLQWKLNVASVWNTVSGITSTSQTITGLAPNNTYNYKVQTICTGEESAFTAPKSFTTPNICGVPTNSVANIINAFTVYIQWDAIPNINFYTLQYRKTSTGVWTDVGPLTLAEYTLTTLSPLTNYVYRIKVNCPNANPGISQDFFFTTPDGCAPPNNLVVTNVTATSANASWSSVTSASAYKFQYKVASGSNWTTITQVGTTYNMTGLAPSTEYEARVQSVCGQDTSGYGPTVKFATINANGCGTPTGVTITNITATTANVNWAAVANANSYEVHYKKSTETNWTIVASNVTNVALTNLTGNTTYNVKVRGVCTSGNSDFSFQVDFMTLNNLPCSLPGNLTATNITSNSAVVNWGSVPGALTYKLQYRAETSNNWITISGITTTSQALSSLVGGMTYYYKVRSICLNDSSAYSNEAVFNTTGSIVCGTPANLTATNITTTSSQLNWTGNAPSYKVQYRRTGTIIWTFVTSNVTNLSVTGLIPATQYDYRVQAMCVFGASNYSNVANFTTLNDDNASCAKPTQFIATNITNNSAKISWSAVPGAVSYKVSYKGINNDTTTKSATTITNSITLLNLIVATNYKFWAVTNCGSKSSAASDTLYFSTLNPCGPVTGLKNDIISSTKAKISWDSISGSPVKEWIVRYKLKGDTIWTAAAPVKVNTILLTGLTPDSTYMWQVRSNCAEGSSDFKDTVWFTLNSTCLNPKDLKATDITSSSTLLTWNGGGPTILLQYKRSSETLWTNITTSGNSYLLTGLSQGVTYNAQVRSICVLDSSAIAGPITFTTLVESDCQPPTTITISKITTSSAAVNWTKMPKASFYNIQYRKVGATNWITNLAFSNSFTLTGLQSSTEYEVRINSQCAGNKVSAYSGAVNFTTLGSLPVVLGANWSILPNPTRDLILIELVNASEMLSATIDLFDLNGKLLSQNRLINGQRSMSLDLSGLSSGMYLIRTIYNDKVETHKLVKE